MERIRSGARRRKIWRAVLFPCVRATFSTPPTDKTPKSYNLNGLQILRKTFILDGCVCFLTFWKKKPHMMSSFELQRVSAENSSLQNNAHLPISTLISKAFSADSPCVSNFHCHLNFVVLKRLKIKKVLILNF